MCIVDETNFIRARSLKLVFVLVFYNIMTDDESHPKIIEMRVGSILFKVVLKIISLYDVVLQSDLLKNHLICC